MKFPLLEIGITKCDPADIKRVRILNLTIFISSFYTTIYTVSYGIMEAYPAMVVNFLFLLGQLSLFGIVHSGKSRLASIVFPILVFTHLSTISIFFLTAGAGIHYYLFAVSSLSFLIISERDRKWLPFFVIAAFPLFTFIEYVPFESSFKVDISKQILSWLHMGSTLGTMALITLTIKIFYQETINAQKSLEKERDRSEDLLLNILPADIANRLKGGETVIADNITDSTVLFADIVGFTKLASQKTSEDLVSILNSYFRAFDDLAGKYEVEKIKTIGDAYMVASGVPIKSDNHAEAMASFSLEMIRACARINEELGFSLQLRVGLNSGPVTAGVIGHKKFTYDIWGDTVNVASRMESSGIPGRIQVSASTYELLKDKFNLEFRGKLDIKGKGEMPVYLLNH